MPDIPKGAILQRDKETYAIVPRTPVGLVSARGPGKNCQGRKEIPDINTKPKNGNGWPGLLIELELKI